MGHPPFVALYRDISAYPEPVRSVMQEDLRRYEREVIDVGWPMQRQGIVPNNANSVLSALSRTLYVF